MANEAQSKQELLAEARTKGVDVDSNAPKKDLVAAINEADAGDRPTREERGGAGDGSGADGVVYLDNGSEESRADSGSRSGSRSRSGADSDSQDSDSQEGSGSEGSGSEESEGAAALADDDEVAAGTQPVVQEARSQRALQSSGSEENPEQHGESLLKVLAELPREYLRRLTRSIEDDLVRQPADPAVAAGPTDKEVALGLPHNHEAGSELSVASAAGAVAREDGSDVEEHEIISYAVHQATNPTGQPVGPQFVVAVTSQGEKLTGKL